MFGDSDGPFEIDTCGLIELCILASLSILFLNFGVIFPVMLQALDTLASWPKKRPKVEIHCFLSLVVSQRDVQSSPPLPSFHQPFLVPRWQTPCHRAVLFKNDTQHWVNDVIT